jgi:hypothetical protein
VRFKGERNNDGYTWWNSGIVTPIIFHSNLSEPIFP